MFRTSFQYIGEVRSPLQISCDPFLALKLIRREDQEPDPPRKDSCMDGKGMPYVLCQIVPSCVEKLVKADEHNGARTDLDKFSQSPRNDLV